MGYFLKLYPCVAHPAGVCFKFSAPGVSLSTSSSLSLRVPGERLFGGVCVCFLDCVPSPSQHLVRVDNFMNLSPMYIMHFVLSGQTGM